MLNIVTGIIRKATYFWLSTIIPIHSLDILSMAGFFIPVRSGEKIGYSVAILLTTYVFFILVLGYIPKSSERIALLSKTLQGFPGRTVP